MSTPETPRPLADRLHGHEPITAAESRALALLLWQVQHANRTAGVKGFDDATHFALWTGIRDVYTSETALSSAPVSSSEDTPARVWQEGDKPPCDRKAGHAGLCLPRCTKTPGCTERAPHRGKCTTGLWAPVAQSWAGNTDERCPLSEVPAGGEPA